MDIAKREIEQWRQEKWRYRKEDIKNGDTEKEILKRERDTWRNERERQKYGDIKGDTEMKVSKRDGDKQKYE